MTPGRPVAEGTPVPDGMVGGGTQFVMTAVPPGHSVQITVIRFMVKLVLLGFTMVMVELSLDVMVGNGRDLPVEGGDPAAAPPKPVTAPVPDDVVEADPGNDVEKPDPEAKDPKADDTVGNWVEKAVENAAEEATPAEDAALVVAPGSKTDSTEFRACVKLLAATEKTLKADATVPPVDMKFVAEALPAVALVGVKTVENPLEAALAAAPDAAPAMAEDIAAPVAPLMVNVVLGSSITVIEAPVGTPPTRILDTAPGAPPAMIIEALAGAPPTRIVEATPGAPPTMIVEAAPGAPPTMIVEAAPGAPPKTMVETTPGDPPEMIVETAAGPPPEMMLEGTAEGPAKTIVDVTPGAPPIRIVEAPPGAPPEMMVEITPGAKPEMTVDAAPDAAPGTAPEITVEAPTPMPETAPEDSRGTSSVSNDVKALVMTRKDLVAKVLVKPETPMGLAAGPKADSTVVMAGIKELAATEKTLNAEKRGSWLAAISDEAPATVPVLPKENVPMLPKVDVKASIRAIDSTDGATVLVGSEEVVGQVVVVVE
ncbi:hypothetical protein EJ06DRAFT_38678 [Trichodelitschia bisporula]|uniref:Uncharacterized protein n=1 Tax=Trichodelitschia bisporula TaxID=703511 RepID=A0A6G1HVF9_9PEZI|nr:hypothetical protein EJ06DRAFT_38678 [Trichodelitschia bisporula]